TDMEPGDLLEACLGIERDLKRQRKERWGPRTIDIDIIAYGKRTIREDGLEIPHPRFTSRAFVLVPLAEIAENFEIDGESVGALAARIDTSGIELIAPPERLYAPSGK